LPEGIGQGEIVGVSGPICMGKTLLVLDLAERICTRYGKNVLFYSAHKPSVYLVKKAALKDHISIHFWEGGRSRSAGPAVDFLDSNTTDTNHVLEIAVRL
jgi:hypothetical protein